MTKEKRNLKSVKKTVIVSPFKDYWGKNNYYILYLGLGLLILGYILMAQGPWDNPLSLSISPIILLIAYLVIIPLSIVFKLPAKKDDNVSSKS